MFYFVGRIAAALVLLGTVQSALAIPVRLYFEAQIDGFKQNIREPVGTFLGKPVAMGDLITGYLQYETDLVNHASVTGGGSYYDGTSGSGFGLDFKGVQVSTRLECSTLPGGQCTDRHLVIRDHDQVESWESGRDYFAMYFSSPEKSTGGTLYEASVTFWLKDDHGGGALPKSLSFDDIESGHLALGLYGYTGGHGASARFTKLQTLSPVPEPETTAMGLFGFMALIMVVRGRARRL